METPDMFAATSEIREALSQTSHDTRKILVVVGSEQLNKLEAFKAAASEAGFKVESLSLDGPSPATAEEINASLNKPTGGKVDYLVIDGLDEASEEVQQEIEDAIEARGFLDARARRQLPLLAATAAHTPHWLPAKNYTEVTLPVPQLAVEAPKAAWKI